MLVFSGYARSWMLMGHLSMLLQLTAHSQEEANECRIGLDSARDSAPSGPGVMPRFTCLDGVHCKGSAMCFNAGFKLQSVEKVLQSLKREDVCLRNVTVSTMTLSDHPLTNHPIKNSKSLPAFVLPRPFGISRLLMRVMLKLIKHRRSLRPDRARCLSTGIPHFWARA
jgi:hypothetical protein